MSLRAIVDAIRSSGQAQVHAVEAHTRAQVQEILAQAQVEAQQLRDEAYAAAATPATVERARILQQARLDALQILDDAREMLVDTVLCRTRERLTNTRADAAYRDTLVQLTREAIAALKGSPHATDGIRLEVDPRDQHLLESVIDDLALAASTCDGPNCWGGLIAKSADGRVIVSNTLEDRLERATPYLRRCLAVQFSDWLSVEEVSGQNRPDAQCPVTIMAMHASGR